MDVENIKKLSEYMDCVRKVRTSNIEFSDNEDINQQLIMANMRLGDALFHMQKAFNIFMDQ